MNKNITVDEIENLSIESADWAGSYAIELAKDGFLANRVLHFMHSHDATVRENATRIISEANGDDSITVRFNKYNCFLGDFPQELKEEVKLLLKGVQDDIKVVYTTSWFFSHLMGRDYQYDSNETPQIRVYATDAATYTYASKLITSHFGDTVSFI